MSNGLIRSARAALGEFAEAVEALTRALELEPKSPDILHERGKYFNFRSKDFTAAVKDLSICLKQEKDNKSAHTLFGKTIFCSYSWSPK
uniref:Uncharacterized protein n=1 Tax=Brassica oleracea TaxID=3712 RepID=A0A3P6FSS0_BRAOL|nr:unnamed protein product [Brassica oleracea]